MPLQQKALKLGQWCHTKCCEILHSSILRTLNSDIDRASLKHETAVHYSSALEGKPCKNTHTHITIHVYLSLNSRNSSSSCYLSVTSRRSLKPFHAPLLHYRLLCCSCCSWSRQLLREGDGNTASSPSLITLVAPGHMLVVLELLQQQRVCDGMVSLPILLGGRNNKRICLNWGMNERINHWFCYVCHQLLSYFVDRFQD